MKVLILEDDTATRDYMVDSVEVQGYEVQSAVNGEEGLQKYESFKPDLIVTDIQMPKMDGLKMLEAIRRVDSDVIVVVATAFGSEEYAIDALRLRANNYLRKPVRHVELLPLLSKYEGTVNENSLKKEILGMTLRREFLMNFENNLNLVPKIADYLIQETGSALNGQERLGILLGLTELLANSIEHGNLEIGGEDKATALANNTYDQLLADRMANPKFVSRKVSLSFVLNDDGCEWVITDEGPGFDWESLTNPLDGENILGFSGRGIFVSRFQFDKLEYNDKGNQVTITKMTAP